MAIHKLLKRVFQADSVALRRGGASVLLRLTGAAITLALTIVLARSLGPSGYGAYAYAIAIVTLTASIAQLGIPPLVVRESAKFIAEQHWDELRGLIVRTASLVAVSSAIIASLLVISFWRGWLAAPALDTKVALLSLALLPVFVTNNIGGALLRGFGHAVRGQVAEQLIRPGIFLLLVCGVLIWRKEQGLMPDSTMILHVLSGIVAVIAGLIFLLRAAPPAIRTAPTSYARWPEWRSSMLPFAFLAGLQMINAQADMLMVGIYLDAESVGVYRVAHQAASLVNMTLFAIGLTVEPTIARLYVQTRLEELQGTILATARFAFVLSGSMSILLVVFGSQLLNLVFGHEYADAYLPLAILCGGQVVLSLAGWAVLVLNMSGNERVTARFTALAALVNLLLNAALIPVYGVVGAALATSITIAVWKMTLAIVAERRTSLRTVIFLPNRSGSAVG